MNRTMVIDCHQMCHTIINKNLEELLESGCGDIMRIVLDRVIAYEWYATIELLVDRILDDFDDILIKGCNNDIVLPRLIIKQAFIPLLGKVVFDIGCISRTYKVLGFNYSDGWVLVEVNDGRDI